MSAKGQLGKINHGSTWSSSADPSTLTRQAHQASPLDIHFDVREHEIVR
jgi:hypothetical protein